MTEKYKELRERIAEKRIIISRKEQQLKEQFKDIKKDLSPGKLIVGAVKNVVTEAKPPSGFLNTGISLGVAFLADRLLFRRVGIIARTVGMFAVRKLVNKFTNNHRPHPLSG